MQYRNVAVLTALSVVFLGACGSDENEGTPAPSRDVKIESFVAAPEVIEPGQSTTLSWRTKNATSIVLMDGSGERIPLEGQAPEEGSVELTPEATTTYTLRAQGAGGSDEKEVRVKVANTPSIELFRANRERLTAGEETRLIWEVEGAERVVIRAGEETLFDEDTSGTGSLTIAPERTTTYVLEAHNAHVAASATTTVEVFPVIDVFELLSEEPLAAGEVATLRWEVRAADALILTNLEDEIEIPSEQIAAGQGEIAAATGGVFRLIARSGELETTAEVEADVRPLPRILSFELPEKAAKPADGPALITVAWEVEHAEQILLLRDGGEPIELEGASGELELPLEETMEFTLRAENTVGVAEESRTVILVPPAEILAFTADRPAILPGESVTLSWEVENEASLALARNGEPIEIEPGARSVEDRPAETSVYTLTITDHAGATLSRSLEVVVAEVLVSANLWAEPETVAEGETFTLHWTVTTAVDGAEVSLSLRDDAENSYELEGKDPKGDSLTLPATEAGTYTFFLEAEALGAQAVAETTVLVAVAPTLVLSSNPPALSPVELEEEIELIWETEGAVSLELFRRGSSGTRIPLGPIDPADVESGSIRVEIVGATIFEAEATGPDGVKRVETYTLDFGDPTIHSFTASSTTVAPGSTVTFSWDTDYGVVSFAGIREEPEERRLPLINLAELGFSELDMKQCSGECATLSFPAGFSFPYFGDLHSSMDVALHGFVAFEPMRYSSYEFSGSSCVGGHLWDAPELAIAPYWGDFYLDEPGSGIYWAQGNDLTGRRFVVVEWRKVTNFWDDGIATFQLVLWEDGTFDFRYGAMIGDDVNGEWGAVGHFDPNEYEGYGLFCEELVPGGLSNRAWRHYGPPPAQGSAEIVVDSTGDYELCVRGYAGDTTCETITITVAP